MPRAMKVTFYLKSGNKFTVPLKTLTVEPAGVKWTTPEGTHQLLRLDLDSIEAIVRES